MTQCGQQFFISAIGKQVNAVAVGNPPRHVTTLQGELGLM